MTDETGSTTPPGGLPLAANADPAAAPALNLVGQYIRDLSFENPGAPSSMMGGGTQPKFNVSINVGVKKQQTPDTYAVELTLNAKAERDNAVWYNAELVYGGLFRLRNFSEAQLPVMLMVECPRLIFPFARQVLANITQAGGFPPLMMDPVDFTQIYRQNLQAFAQAQSAKNAAPN